MTASSLPLTTTSWKELQLPPAPPVNVRVVWLYDRRFVPLSPSVTVAPFGPGSADRRTWIVSWKLLVADDGQPAFGSEGALVLSVHSPTLVLPPVSDTTTSGELCV
jgi:hypothetical protein